MRIRQGWSKCTGRLDPFFWPQPSYWKRVHDFLSYILGGHWLGDLTRPGFPSWTNPHPRLKRHMCEMNKVIKTNHLQMNHPYTGSLHISTPPISSPKLQTTITFAILKVLQYSLLPLIPLLLKIPTIHPYPYPPQAKLSAPLKLKQTNNLDLIIPFSS